MIAPQFCLETKGPKIQDKKKLQPAGPTPGPVFCRAFALFGIVLIPLVILRSALNDKGAQDDNL